MPDCSGPGRYNATKAIISSKTSGCRRSISSFMPRDSSWKTAVVLAARNNSKDFLSSNGMVLILIGFLFFSARCLFTVFTAQSIMVRFLKPRKSNLTSPTASTSSLSNCDTTLPPPSSQYSGVKSTSVEGEISTPPACLPTLRVSPSSDKAKSINSLTSSS